MKALNINKYLLLSIIAIISTIYIYSNITKYYSENAFIEHCIEACFKDIYYYMTQEDSASYFGHYDIPIGTKKIPLISNFYVDYIINKEYIMNYLEKLNWYEIIAKNKKDILTIIPTIRKEYVTFIKEQEAIYTLTLLQDVNLNELKENIINILQIVVENSALNPLQKNFIINNEFLTNILETVNWHFYILTVECQNKDFTTLIEHVIINAIEAEHKIEQRRLHVKIYMDPIVSYTIALVFNSFLKAYCIAIGKVLAKKGIVVIKKTFTDKYAHTAIKIIWSGIKELFKNKK